MNDAPPDELIRRLSRLEQENAMMRQGMQQSARMRDLWEQAIEELQATRRQLETSNGRLSILHLVSSAVHQTLDLERLFENILDAMEVALPQARGLPKGLFLIDEDRMRLVASRFTDEAFIAAHASLRTGQCLCGRTTALGELMVIPACDMQDGPQPACAPEGGHGHLVVPLTSQNQAVGIFFYYLPPGTAIDAGLQETFVAIGQHLGLALEHARLYEETRTLSLCDSLTGLANRRRMERVLESELARVTRYERPLSVLLIDIDRFKEYNDTLGHLAGDRLLARLGGEEFLMILPETPLAGAQKMAERLRLSVSEQAGITVSIGVADVTPSRRDRDTLLQASDDALYRAKQNGRNRVETAPG